MNIKKKKILYEKYHIQTSSQLHLINEKNFTYRIILSVLKRYLKKNSSILDIGCGAGTLCLYYASQSKEILGIDISQKAVESARLSARNLKIKNVNFKEMNFPKQIPKGKFDTVILTEVIEHLDDDEAALQNIYSLLKPKGVVIISTPSNNAPLYKLGLTKKFDERVGHVRRYNIDELVSKCESVGLKVLETKKTEGIVRNFLFTNPTAGKTVRFIKYFMADIVSFIDGISLLLFGESDIFVIAEKQ